MIEGPILVLGAGQAGIQIADQLRRDGYQGELALIGDEPGLPYQRPPLSKEFLAGELPEDRLLFRDAAWFAANHIELVSGLAATAIDREARTVSFADGSRRRYQGLALATGTRPRPLPIPGGALPGVMLLRSLADSLALRAALAEANRVVVAGGGFIGLEVAAVARKLGHPVTVVELRERLMPRVVTPLISDFYKTLHQDHGVEIRLGTGIAAVVGTDRAAGLRLADGLIVPADLVVAGIGVLPNDEIARAAGLACDNGIVVDEYCRTSDPAIVAAGDCTNHPNRFFAGRVRLEAVQNATDQARTAAASLLGIERPYDAVPWFWSEQYDIRLQMVGRQAGHERHVLRGEPDARRFTAFYFQDGRLIGADSINAPADHMATRRLIAAGAPVTPEQLADPAFDLRAAATAAGRPR